MSLNYLIWMLIIIVCCISFFFLSKKEEDKKGLWRKISLIGFCAGSVLHFALDLTVGRWGMASNVFIPWHGYALMYLTGAGVFLTVFVLVYYVSSKLRSALLWSIVLLFAGLFISSVYANNYDYASGRGYCGAGQGGAVRPGYVKLFWCPAESLKQD